jgi:hypothetical protein
MCCRGRSSSRPRALGAGAELGEASDLEHERAREGSSGSSGWNARYESNARAAYDAVEPENRLVARTLERTLEERLGAEQKLREDYHRACAACPVTLTDAERSAIRALATDLPKLWNNPTTTNEQRKEVVRQLVDEARLHVEGDSERVTLTLRWAGGHETTTTLTRPVAKLSQLSYHDDLVRRAEQLQHDGKSLQQMADTLNAEGWRPAKTREAFSRSMVRGLLPSNHTMSPSVGLEEKLELAANEWTMQALAAAASCRASRWHYCWVKRGWVRALGATTPPGQVQAHLGGRQRARRAGSGVGPRASAGRDSRRPRDQRAAATVQRRAPLREARRPAIGRW